MTKTDRKKKLPWSASDPHHGRFKTLKSLESLKSLKSQEPLNTQCPIY